MFMRENNVLGDSFLRVWDAWDVKMFVFINKLINGGALIVCVYVPLNQ